ncbi:MAG TPA: ATP-binding cassette domain-containing protein, partial [Arenicellales bacterium]|nr:ATP-binding cassette domain-containing protein [Arenicellales bacterium]
TGYFDQHRRELDLDKTVAQVVGDGRDYVILDGKPRHVVGYLKGFLFSAERALTPVRALSGGERNRVILARLFTRAANLLVLDEPTNDLDVETLEVLEGRLAAYSGTLIVVSHDRAFLDNTVTSILVFEQDGRIRHYAGGYSDWARRDRLLASVEESSKGAPGAHDPTGENRSAARSANKLSYKLQREMDILPDAIQHLEQEIQQLQAQTLGAGFYDQAYQQKQPVLDELARLEVRLEQQVSRWAELAELDVALRGNP